MGLLKDIKELVGINTGDEDDERDEELEEETTSKALSKRQKMEAEEVDEFRYEDYSTIFIDPKQFEDCKKIATYIEKEKMITINLENIGPNVAQRIMDFLAGAMEIKNASFAQIAKHVLYNSSRKYESLLWREKKRKETYWFRKRWKI